MNTRKSFNRSIGPRRFATPAPLMIVAAGVLILMQSGCGQGAGAMLYWSGLFQAEKVEPKFTFSEGPLLILVDDPEGLVHMPQTLTQLAQAMRTQLVDNEAARKVMPADTANRLRSSHPDFDDRGCREIGRLAGAEQVLWLEVRDFYSQEEIEQVTAAAKLSVSVKVIDTGSGVERSKARAWPTYPEGERITADMTATEVTRAKDREGVSRALAERLAGKIAKLFYEHRADEFGSGK